MDVVLSRLGSQLLSPTTDELRFWEPAALLSRSKASSIKWPYEVASQAARIASLVFLTVALVQGRVHLLNVLAVAYAFVLGLIRPLSNDLIWRHLVLHQINYVVTATFFVLMAAQLLPCIQIDTDQCIRDVGVVGFMSSLGAAVVVALITPREWVPPTVKHEIPGYTEQNEPAPEETCSWFNYYFTYEWLTPLVWKGTRRKLDMSGIPTLAWYDEPMYLLQRIQKARAVYKKTLWTALKFQRKELALMATWAAAAFTLENVSPYGMYRLLDYIANPSAAQYHPVVWLILMFVGPLSRSVLFQQYVFNSTRLIVRVKSAMTQELYHRALASMELEEDPFDTKGGNASKEKEAQGAQKSTSAGRLANLMAADVDAVYRARDVILVSAGVPAGTIISLFGLYKMMGWVSLVGTAILLLATPISVYMGRRMYGAQRRVRKAQDTRISLVAEYLASIRAIKYFAWEDPITNRIIEARAAEQKELWRVAVLQTMVNQVTQCFPYIGLLVMFALHVGVEKHPLDASTAFTAAFLVKNIRRNIMMASAFSRNFAAASVAFNRLDKYFDSTVPLIRYPVGPLRIEGASFRRNKKATFRLEDISLDFVEGGLNVITGQSGSGKSTLLLAILGETHLEGGKVTAPSDIAFASQSAWLQNDTIQANILFQAPMDRARYDRVIEACCLNIDLKELSDGDQTVVGENGTSLSGGQKARVALARALYSTASLLLLDDIFSALDAKTSAGVWKHCFCSDLLKGRTVVLVTQVPWISAQADFSVLLDRGQVKSAEHNIGAVRRPIQIAEILGGDDDDIESETQVGTETPPEPELQSSGDALNDPAKVATETSAQDIVNQEMKASGRVGRLASLEYMRYFGHPLFAVFCLVGLAGSNVFFFASSYWMGIWVEAYNNNAHVDIAYYMGIYAAFTFAEIISFGIVIIAFEWGAWRAGRKLHNDFIRAVMRVPLSWFKTIPIGRITNRFSGDMASIDSGLSSMLRVTFDSIMMLFARIAAVSSIMPIFMIPAFFTCIFGVVVGEMYTRTAVIIKRLASSAQSPVFSQFADTLAGLPIIRARAGMSETFGHDLAAKLRVWSAAAEANYNCNRWVAMRVDFVTSLVALFAGIIALSKVGIVGAGLVGFSLNNANGLSQTILMLVRAMNDLEVEMQSFHRVKEYVKLEPEGKDDVTFPEEGQFADDESHVIPRNWPRSGEIEFRNVTIRYDPDGPNILTDVNLKFKAGERVAVVGRTGSGKSTLVLSLLRFTHIVSGQILYDGIDITKVPRRRLRESLTIIPQEATLFNGTVESNLDPTGRVPKAILEKALENCKGIASFSSDDSSDETIVDGSDDGSVRGQSQGISLSTPVDARGENFSHGQRQVLSLCRALIRQSKLMLLDEATASMDYETDKGIQQVLRNELESAGGDRTLVTIAHRLRTIIDYDSVVVMGAGKVVEYGSPRDLYHSKGLFYDMIYHSGEMEELEELLKEN
ncbi:P-loop containing nucleoside triphosphate hydrolase protein [Trichoderma citrinoviride]|uniref:P-loop containing nucleoside triphosphate hydrolase protein n=1 Tax=Trichoderma citrinoviride TaxID=58853 RepID=A0A2T4BNS3_9HYPO|nr:P-loop containing nucleoside triphosphate hydrolase protein [Trichoderma citrinoviride]PTB70909.1 P-loop containing nucleoside triphosphate hydrolase protein [Trichoderma citrinoviride]